MSSLHLKYSKHNHGVILTLIDDILSINTIHISGINIIFNMMVFNIHNSSVNEVLEILLIRYSNNGSKTFKHILTKMLSDVTTGNI